VSVNRRRFLKLVGGAGGLIVVGGAGYAGVRFEANRRQVASSGSTSLPRLGDVGAVRNLSILPLIDWYPGRDGLVGEPGVSYLIRTDDSTVLMDAGLNSKGENPSPLLRNAAALDVSLDKLDALVISHPHNDHVGGTSPVGLTRSADPFDLHGIPAYLPSPLACPTASPVIVDSPRVIATGIATMGPLECADFLSGVFPEQSLAVSVQGKGIVLVVGCGHPGVERILARAESLFDQPIYGMMGGLHYPVTAARTAAGGVSLQKFVCTGKWPWQPIDQSDVAAGISALQRRSPKVVALSAHDSCDWTLGAFREAFGPAYRRVAVGEEIVF
jgi:7,8-dihydropterin-6-yl-methyl-4-(beta-D-ribofuranosyl)aminobenzene 5'-phosphate synthase